MEGERREPDQGVFTSCDERAQRALSFGQVAELYDQWRPGYPDALYAHGLGFGSGRHVLEAGAGTGRATLELARRRASVVAVEPDGAMAAVARQRTQGMAVNVQESMFEDCTVAAGAFDLVVAAQAWALGRSRARRCRGLEAGRAGHRARAAVRGRTDAATPTPRR